MLEPSEDLTENVLVVTDVFSSYTQAVPTNDRQAPTVAKVVVNEWLYKFMPGHIRCDSTRSRQ